MNPGRVPVRAQASSLSPPRPGVPDPYRLLFPIGLTWGLAGAGLWPLHALGHIAWPGIAHRMLMIQGFEQSFVLGFLLTAIPGFTRGERCRPWELAVATTCALGFGVAILAGWVVVAETIFTLSVLLLFAAVARRIRVPSATVPLEMMFVGLGLLLGLAGGLVQLGVAAGLPEPAPRLGERLISLGMVLSLVLGVGGLLVPVFAGMRDPLVVPGVGGPHQRGGRRVLYAALIAGLALAFAAEVAGRPRLGAVLRAAAASAVGMLVWKLWRMPGRRTLHAVVLWSSGWLVLAGLWAMALAPGWTLGALHVTFIGGFAPLTMAIGTRVVVAHGHHPPDDEARTLSPLVVITSALALLARLAAEFDPAHAAAWLGMSGALWMLGLLMWALRAVPRLARPRPAPVRPTVPASRPLG